MSENNFEFLSLEELNNKLQKYDTAKEEYLRLKAQLENEQSRYNGNNNVSALSLEIEKAGNDLHKLADFPLLHSRLALTLTKGEFIKAKFIQFRHEWTDVELMRENGEVFNSVNGADIDGEEYISVYYDDRTETFYEKELSVKNAEKEINDAKLRW